MEEERLGSMPEGQGGDWPLRPWLLAGGLALAGLLIHFASHDHEQDAGRMALTALLFFGPLAAAFALEREKWKEVAIFAAIVGLAMAGIAWRAVHAEEHYAGMQFAFAAGVIATLLSVPLFQAGFHKARFATPYKTTHFFVWTDVVTGGGALAFTGLTFVMTAVLGQLFHLLKIDFLQHLLEKEWFDWMLAGGAFGAALGVLRNQLKVIGTLQSVVLLVLSLLAVPLALALVVFLGAMVVSGPRVLWEATRSATPTLLACAVGSFVLVNAVVRDEDGASSKSPVMRIAALVLALGILPLTIFAAVSMGTRVSAYGLSPERLWGLIAIAVACAYGLAYLVAVLLGRKRAWREKLRGANFHLAAGTCLVALVLALPVLDFGAVSAANQVARLEKGEVSAKDFDFAALRWDFGDAGRRALERLAKGGNATVAELAQVAMAQNQRSYYRPEPVNKTRSDFALRMQPDDPALREQVLNYLVANPGECSESCVALDLGFDAHGKRLLVLVAGSGWTTLRLDGTGSAAALGPAAIAAEAPTLRPNSKVELRVVPERHVFIDGKPVDGPLDELEGVPPPR
jgi:hypothetical protein